MDSQCGHRPLRGPQQDLEREPKDSAPIALLEHVWRNIQAATSHSWLKINHHMRDALELAVKSGMKFEEDDLAVINDRYRPGYWVGDYEWFYRLAVVYRNRSAWKAFEKRFNRKPFIIKGATLRTNYGDGPAGQGLARLVVGAAFAWDGRKVFVTSFNDKDGTITACSYRMDGEAITCETCRHRTSWPREVIDKRYTLSPADLKAGKK